MHFTLFIFMCMVTTITAYDKVSAIIISKDSNDQLYILRDGEQVALVILAVDKTCQVVDLEALDRGDNAPELSLTDSGTPNKYVIEKEGQHLAYMYLTADGCYLKLAGDRISIRPKQDYYVKHVITGADATKAKNHEEL